MPSTNQQPQLKISIIGPTLPYRGGIVQYNTDLAYTLKKLAKVDLISFKRQYPTFLYPGATNNQEDEDFAQDISYILDSNNPRSWQTTVNTIKKQNPDVLLINWWTLFWQPAFWYISKKLQRSNIPVIFICHNLYDHDITIFGHKIPERLLKTSSKWLLKVADGYLVHSSLDAKELIKIIGNKKPVVQKPLPSPTTFPEPTSKKLPSDKLELLFIGFIRPYKGLDLLIEAYAKLSESDRKRINLQVVGEVWGDKTQLAQQLDSLGISHNLAYASSQSMVNYINNSDIVVLPYKSASGSGIIPLAYHLNRPVIATKVGGISDVVIPNQTGWLIEPNSQALSDLLHQIKSQDYLRLSKNLQVNGNDWNAMAKSIIDLINQVRV
ncbi:glycosyltransferase [Candidatus Nomurabacteria bacterium]|nr:glycosyltransferase [Candidatus Nomurabacteria bacterium]